MWPFSIFLLIPTLCFRTVLLSPSDIDGQSTFGMANSEAGETDKIPLQIREAASVLRSVGSSGLSSGQPSISLLHVNCEGCEWEMLENIIHTGEHKHVR